MTASCPCFVVFGARPVFGQDGTYQPWEIFGIGTTESETKTIGFQVLTAGCKLALRKTGEGFPEALDCMIDYSNFAA
jgi:hypothetical protein